MGRIGDAFKVHRWLEAVVWVSLVLTYIWCVEPAVSQRGKLLGFLLLAAIPVCSQLLRRDRIRDLGIRVDNLKRSGRDMALATVVGTLVLVILGKLAGWRIELRPGTALMPIGYTVWGFSQQYALQSYVHRRLRQTPQLSRSAPMIAALCFGLVHLPNPVLVVATTLMGYLWCRLYQREPNLFTLAISHALLATTLMASVPSDVHHSMRVGPRWFDCDAARQPRARAAVTNLSRPESPPPDR